MGQTRQFTNKESPIFRTCERASIKKHVGFGSERLTPASNFRRARLDFSGIESVVAKAQRAGIAMGDYTQNINIAQPLERASDLSNGITLTVDLDDLRSNEFALWDTCNKFRIDQHHTLDLIRIFQNPRPGKLPGTESMQSQGQKNEWHQDSS